MRRRSILLVFLLLVAGAAAFWWFRPGLRRAAYEGVDRETWQQPDRVLRELEIAPGQAIADVGAGSGYFTFRFAGAVGPLGKVYAVDIDPEMTEYIARQAGARGLAHIETVPAAVDDPKIPQPVDLIFVSNTYHHLQNRADYFRRVQRYLRPGGRVAIVEYSGRDNWFARFFGHSTSAETIRSEMRAAGFQLAVQHDFLAQQHFLIFALDEKSDSR